MPLAIICVYWFDLVSCYFHLSLKQSSINWTMSTNKWRLELSSRQDKIFMILESTFRSSHLRLLSLLVLSFNNLPVSLPLFIQSILYIFLFTFSLHSQRHVLRSRVNAMQSVCSLMIPPSECVSVHKTVPMSHALYVAVMEKLTSTSVSWK